MHLGCQLPNVVPPHMMHTSTHAGARLTCATKQHAIESGYTEIFHDSRGSAAARPSILLAGISVPRLGISNPEQVAVGYESRPWDFVGGLCLEALSARPLSRRHRSLQYLMSSQFLSHFFRHEKGLPQTAQSFCGKFVFLTPRGWQTTRTAETIGRRIALVIGNIVVVVIS